MNWFNKDTGALWLMNVQQTPALLTLLEYSSQVHILLKACMEMSVKQHDAYW